MLIEILGGIQPRLKEDKMEIDGNGTNCRVSVLIKRLGANLQRCNLADIAIYWLIRQQ